MTITAKGVSGSPIPNVSASIAVSGSNNTLHQPSGNTDVNGVATATFSSTTAETKTVTATAGGVTITQQPSVVVSGSGPAADFVEDFSTYSSTANMLSDPRGIYSTAEDVNTGFMVLDTTVGYGSSTKSMRYDWPDRTGEGGSGTSGRCSDDTIGRNLSLPSNKTEMWIELVTKTNSAYKTLAPGGWGCTSAAAYKTIFGRADVSRANIVLGIFGETADYTVGYPGNEEPADYAMTWTPFDGNVHVYRWHLKLGSGVGICTLMVDGTTVKSFTSVSPSASYYYGIALGRNMNQGPGATQSIWFLRLQAWFPGNDPGWGI
ncbi:MAG TPA: Ig-like domain-containing protein [Gemmatimonadales bacterium]|nr:Ig-like domain-containing protein [Gemmatimonadales bacterium]